MPTAATVIEAVAANPNRISEEPLAVALERHIQAAGPELTGVGPRLPSPVAGDPNSARRQSADRVTFGPRTPTFEILVGGTDIVRIV